MRSMIIPTALTHAVAKRTAPANSFRESAAGVWQLRVTLCNVWTDPAMSSSKAVSG